MRLKPEHRRQLILSVALRLAVRRGYRQITREAVAAEARCVPALINRYFPTMRDLQTEVLREAIRREVLPVVVQGLACLDPITAEAPMRLIRRAANWMLRGGIQRA